MAGIDRYAASPYLTPVVYEEALMHDCPTWMKELNLKLAEERRRLLKVELELASLDMAGLDVYADAPYLTPVVYDAALMRDWSTRERDLNLKLAEQRRRVREAELKWAKMNRARALRESLNADGEVQGLRSVPHRSETANFSESKMLVHESENDELSSRVSSVEEVADGEAPADASNNIGVLPVEGHAHLFGMLRTEFVGNAELNLEEEEQGAVAATRMGELNDVSDADLQLEKSSQCDTDSAMQLRDADLGTKLQGVGPGVRPIHNSLCGGELTTTESSPSLEVARVSPAPQSREAGHETMRVPGDDSAALFVQSLSEDVAVTEPVAYGWSNSDKERMLRGEERRPCGIRKESFAVETVISKGITMVSSCSGSPGPGREDNYQSKSQVFRGYRLVLNPEPPAALLYVDKQLELSTHRDIAPWGGRAHTSM
ncbi:hypothetical protein MTO96_051153 [Rhipicephalus appendiculatus]